MSDRVPLIRVTAMPADTNPYGGVFGGWLMGQMGLAAGSLASRHSRGKAVVGQHAESASDVRRTAFLASRGYRVLRFWNNDILQNLEGVAESILAALETPHPAQPAAESPSPSRGEENTGVSHG